ncbi:hypothetical protein [Acidisphaera sp. L21]|uniref:hypothetical protein n=1 Tax=Acidisphaera sp. L21 TaxID=1641851 RepID=UPI00131A6EDA|nr:hypothetical protein [Acidisphaera sp. L21]
MTAAFVSFGILTELGFVALAVIFSAAATLVARGLRPTMAFVGLAVLDALAGVLVVVAFAAGTALAGFAANLRALSFAAVALALSRCDFSSAMTMATAARATAVRVASGIVSSFAIKACITGLAPRGDLAVGVSVFAILFDLHARSSAIV